MDERDFGEDYFLHDCGRPYQRDQHFLQFFGRIADAIVSGIRPRRVLDAGCAMGLLVEALRAPRLLPRLRLRRERCHAVGVRYRRSLQPMETRVYQYERRLLALRSERDDARAARRQAEERMANVERGTRQTVAAAWRRAARMMRRVFTLRDSGPSS